MLNASYPIVDFAFNICQTQDTQLSKYLFGVVRVLLYSIIEFLCPQKDVI